jgi:Tfp pilus assembly protein PilX
MKTFLESLHDDSGFTLVSGLIMLVLLTGLGTYAINLSQVESALSASLKTSKQAFYLADAGLERGRALVATSAALPPAPATTTQSLGTGSYTVSFPNVFPAGPAFEYTVTVRAVGTVGTASKTLQTLVTKTYTLSDAAISIRGNEADSTFTGNAFSIDGRDYHHVTETLTGGAEQYGITVPNAARLANVDGALSAQQKDNIIGKAGQGTAASIGVSGALPSGTVTSLADALCNAAPAANKFTIPLLGSYSPPNSATWGTRATPKVHCVTGVGVPGTMSVDIHGNFSGVGVLVVRDADLVINGASHFEGLIIVTGNKVGFGLIGGGNKELYGSVLINETAYDGPSYREDVIQGASVLRYSSSALNVARQLMPAAALSSVIATLPATSQQRAWHEVNP